jgi:putative ubiquitin-RnfH superfamily antitoxin RatB of RatAB toxin-antitoxin module
MAQARDLAVEVVYALPDRVIGVTARVPSGTTVGETIEQSGIARLVQDIDPRTAPAGIFGRVVARSTPVRDGDRIEIYRPLVADPKQARRQRSGRSVRSGG